MKDWKVTKKFVFTFGLIAGIMIFSSLIATLEVASINRALTEMKETVKDEQLIAQMTKITWQGNIIMLSTLGAGIVNAILAFVFGKKLSREILAPLDEFSKKIHLIIHGELSAKIEYSSKDEFGNLSKDFNKMLGRFEYYMKSIILAFGKIEKGDFKATLPEDFEGDFKELENSYYHLTREMQKILHNISETADQVFAEAKGMEEGSLCLTESCNEQAAGAEEITASINETAEKMTQNQEIIESAGKYIQNASSYVQKSFELVEKLCKIMDLVKKASKKNQKGLDEINNIAFNSNILSMNAAIEAANSGGSSSGFKVVADQVKNLADDSKGTAEEIRKDISNMEVQLGEGDKCSEELMTALKKTIEEAEKVAESMSEIVNSFEDQLNSIQQIQESAEQINGAIQQNAATSQEMTASSVELDATAKKLNDLLSNYSF